MLGSWGLGFGFRGNNSLLQQPGPQKFNLSKIELIHKAVTFKVPPLNI